MHLFTAYASIQHPYVHCGLSQVKCLQYADQGYMDRVNMYSSFYVAIRKAE